MVAEAQTAGVLEEEERAMISGIVRLADRPVREVMTPRTEIDWIDVGSRPEEVRQALLDSPHNRLPVADGAVENIVGVIQTRDVLAASLEGRPIDLHRLCRKAPVIPDLMDAMDALAVLRSPTSRWRWSMTNMAISTVSSHRAASSPLWPAPSPATSTRATSRRWSSATTAASSSRAQQAPIC